MNALVIIDPLMDFIDGQMGVPGAKKDMERLSSFIKDEYYHNLAKISKIFVFYDNHPSNHVSFPSYFIQSSRDFLYPSPFTKITLENKKDFQTRNPNNQGVFDMYLSKVKEHTIYPYHCRQGELKVYPYLLDQLRMYEFNSGEVRFLEKGYDPHTEQYGILECENGKIPNKKIIKELKSYNKIYISGIASSHCKLASAEQMAKHLGHKKLKWINEANMISGYEDLTRIRLENTKIQRIEWTDVREF